MSLKENLLQNDRSLKDSYFVQTQLQCSQWQSSLSQSIDFSPSKEKNPFPTAWQEPSEGFTQINTID